MKTYRLDSMNSRNVRGLSNTSKLTSEQAPARSWGVVLSAAALLACAGLTVFSSARVMLSSHDLAELHAEQIAIQQEIRFLESEYAVASSLEKVQAYAETAGLVNSTKIAGVVSETVPLAQRQ